MVVLVLYLAFIQLYLEEAFNFVRILRTDIMKFYIRRTYNFTILRIKSIAGRLQ